MKSFLFTSLALIFFLTSCKFQSAPKNCGEYKGNNLLIFVGEKIEVTDISDTSSPDEFDLFYGKYKAKFKVVEKICGDYDKNTITFIAYDHYGMPRFARYKNSILYLYKENDTFYNVRYMSDDVYKTKDGKWVSPYSFMNYDSDSPFVSSIKPVKIEFAEEVSYDVKGRSRQFLERHYPSSYYTISNKRAIATHGNYVSEIVQLKKERGLSEFFEPPDSNNQIKVQDVELADIAQVKKIKINEPNVVKTFYKFIEAFKNRDTATIRKMSLANVYCAVCEEPPRSDYENNIETLDSFIVSVYKYFPFTQLMLEIENKVYKASAESYDSEKPKNFQLKTGEKFIVYRLSFFTISDIDNSRIKQSHDFEFVSINGEYKFYGMKTNHAGSKWLGNK